jgi:hypothetical protein
LNLSSFSNSSEIATLILPISITNYTDFNCLIFFCKPQRLSVFPISKSSEVMYYVCFCCHFLFTFLLIPISYYVYTRL